MIKLSDVSWTTLAAASVVFASAAYAARVWRRKTETTKLPATLDAAAKQALRQQSPALLVDYLNYLIDGGVIHTTAQLVYVARGGTTSKRVTLDADVLQAASVHDGLSPVSSRLWGVVAAQHSEMKALEVQRKTVYSDELHEELLRALWEACFDTPYERTSDEWARMGFQGIDPTTDLRGGGVLALEQFLHFAQTRPLDIAAMMSFNADQLNTGETSWYLTAVCSIQFTVQLMSERDHVFPLRLLDVLYAGECRAGLNLIHHQLMVHFRRMWEADLPFVMEYNQYMPKVYGSFFAA